jgi:small subunit ribosomal protein S13|tara:strand:+ start:794 stop:1264 length:471 start_codon:yes stop_codon:yes gene_type:complete
MSEFNYIVRIEGKDIDGTKKVVPALSAMKGIGMNMAHMIISSLKLNPQLYFGALNDDQIAKIMAALKDPGKLGIPNWALNSRKDLETGTDTHFISSDLQMNLKKTIEREIRLGSWRGVRHSLGLTVRGQRTRTSGRKGRSVGVKKSVLAASRSKKE